MRLNLGLCPTCGYIDGEISFPEILLLRLIPTKLATLERLDVVLFSWFCGIKTVEDVNFIGDKRAIDVPINENKRVIRNITFFEFKIFLKIKIKLKINDKVTEPYFTGTKRIDPRDSLKAFVDEFKDQNISFKKGDYLLCGSLTQPYKINMKDKIIVTYENLRDINIKILWKQH